MSNDIKLGNSKPVDKHLRPLKVDGEPTSLETAQQGDGARVSGGLEVTKKADINGVITIERNPAYYTGTHTGSDHSTIMTASNAAFPVDGLIGA